MLVPEVVFILDEILVPVGLIVVILGSITSNGIFWDTCKLFPPPDFVDKNVLDVSSSFI